MCVDKYNANLCLFRGGGDIRRIKQWDWNLVDKENILNISKDWICVIQHLKINPDKV